MYLFFIGPVLLPVTPAALTISTGSNNVTTTLINDGEINIMHDPKLKEAAFEVLLPTGSKYPFAIYGLGGAEAFAFTTYFKTLQARKIPFPFIVAKMRTGSLIPRGYEYFTATIEDYEQKEDASDGLDMIVSLKLKEYREYATTRVDSSGKATKQRGKSFTSEIKELAGDLAGAVGGMFGL